MVNAVLDGLVDFSYAKYSCLYDYKKEDYLFYYKDGFKVVIKGPFVCVEEENLVGNSDYAIYDKNGCVVESRCFGDKELRGVYDRVIGGIDFLRENKVFRHNNSFIGGVREKDFIFDSWLITKEYPMEFSISKDRKRTTKTFFRYKDGELILLSNARGRSRKDIELFREAIDKSCMSFVLEDFLSKKV